MKLRRVDARRRRVELPPGAEGARRPRGDRETLWVALSDPDGQLGLGEAAPLPGTSTESLTEVERQLAELPREWALDPHASPAAAMAAWARARGLAPALGFALETAFVDLCARRTGVPFEAQLGGPAWPEQRTARLVTELGALLDLGPAPGEAVKVKVGRAGAARDELDALRRFRGGAGAETELRLDANEGWSAEDWLRLAPALAELRPVWVEDPVPASVWVELPRSPVPLALDAPLARAPSATLERLLARTDVAAVVLKPSALGGLHAARRWSAQQSARGRAVVYSHLYEGPLGYSALAAASLSDPAARLAAGLAPHPGLGRLGSPPALERLRGTRLCPGQRPGLGFELEETVP